MSGEYTAKTNHIKIANNIKSFAGEWELRLMIIRMTSIVEYSITKSAFKPLTVFLLK